jgi:hypothetical protein
MDPFSQLNAACLMAFGQEASIHPDGGDSFSATGILEKETGEERNADGVYAKLFLNRSDCSTMPARGDAVTVSGTEYKVFDVELDSGGGVWLSLRS